jgi:hypothetical protein
MKIKVKVSDGRSNTRRGNSDGGTDTGGIDAERASDQR